MKAIETEYKGYRFRSRLEARWAVFFDTCGVKWEYEPEGFDLGDGIYYLPDFLLHDVYIRDGEAPIDLWVEVKGQMTADDAKKIIKFADARWVELEDHWFTINVDNPTLIVTNIPDGDDYKSYMKDLAYDDKWSKERVYPFNLSLIDGDWFGAFPVINKQGRLVIADDNYRCFGDEDCNATEEAYRLARQARFEHNDNINFATSIDILTAPNGINIDIVAIKDSPRRFVKAARIYSAITGLNASISLTHPIIRAADSIGAKWYRFATKRLSGGKSYGGKSYCFLIDDIPKILAQYVELHWNSKNPNQVQYNQSAQELRQWLKKEIFPQYVVLQ